MSIKLGIDSMHIKRVNETIIPSTLLILKYVGATVIGFSLFQPVS